MTSFGYRVDVEGSAHVWVSVFAGPDAEHRANTGQLTMRHEEFHAFEAMIATPWFIASLTTNPHGSMNRRVETDGTRRTSQVP